ncbi:MAG: hypothetical protein LBD01_04230 [Puniceicoccales bacterium]|jgi:hypothetical protein|nr:hypothetical protein [Puniceicoccales bacterium]
MGCVRKSSFFAISLLALLGGAVFPVVACCAAVPTVARTWLAKPANFDKQVVATYVAGVDESGLFASDAPFAVLRVMTAEREGLEGGVIFLLVPPASAEATVRGLEPPEPGAGKKTNFGSKITLRRLDATLHILNGEPVLVKDGSAKALVAFAKRGKPSAVFAKQLKAAGLEPVAKYFQKDFVVSQPGRSGTPEAGVPERFLLMLNARRQRETPAQKALSAQALRAEIRNGAEYIFDDDATKTTWRLVWK